AATTVYHAPRLPVAATKPGLATRIFTSPVTMILFALLLAAGIAFLVIGLVPTPPSGVPPRIAEFVSLRELQRPTSAPVVVGEEAIGKDAWTRFRELLEIARISVEPELLVVGTIVATVLVFILIF